MPSIYAQHQQTMAASVSAPALNLVTVFHAPRTPLVDYPSPGWSSVDDQVESDDELIEDTSDRSVYRAYRDYLATQPVQAPPVQPSAIRVEQPSPSHSSKRQREDARTAPISPRASGSQTHVRHHPTVSPSRQRVTRSTAGTVATTSTDEESSRPAKRPRAATPPTAVDPTVAVPAVPALSAIPAIPAASVPTILDGPAPPTVNPSSPRRLSRQVANPENTYAARQAKLAEVSDAKKRADLKKKAKVIAATRTASKRPMTPADDEGAHTADLVEVASPKPAASVASKTKKAATVTTRKRAAKVVEVKNSSKMAAVKTKAKAKTAGNARAKTNNTSAPTVPRRSSRIEAALASAAEVVDEEEEEEEEEEAETASVNGKGKGQVVPPRRSARLSK
ncbi:hypothetical protein FRB93_010314 [Tulasnella sp. JGI-2019a]|nr:hypothetical protein FRB93_010314 [Tulasnella sp. JGI-2019a]